MDKSSKLDFLLAPRFWAMVLGSASTILIDPGFPTQMWYVSLGKFLALLSAGFITVGTVDRVSDKMLEGKKVTASTQNTTVSMPSNTTVTATNETPGSNNTGTPY